MPLNKNSLSIKVTLSLIINGVFIVFICFQEKAFGSKATDSLIGHTLVLLQYDWENNEALFTQIIKKIQKQSTFTYNLFFNYIISIL